MKKINFNIGMMAPILFLLFGCQINNIEFEVKADFDVDVTVSTDYDGNEAGFGSGAFAVTSFTGVSEIDLSDKIDNIGDITTLEITGVTLELKGYNAYTYRGAGFGAVYKYTTEGLTGNLKVELLSNSSNKTLFSEDVNLGTNQKTEDGSIDMTDADPVTLTISTTSAKELIENDKVKLKITMTNGNIRDKNFIIAMKVKSRAITTQ